MATGTDGGARVYRRRSRKRLTVVPAVAQIGHDLGAECVGGMTLEYVLRVYECGCKDLGEDRRLCTPRFRPRLPISQSRSPRRARSHTHTHSHNHSGPCEPRTSSAQHRKSVSAPPRGG